MNFEAKGTFVVKGILNKFTKTLAAENEKRAQEKVYAELGGKNRAKRNNIKITELKVIK